MSESLYPHPYDAPWEPPKVWNTPTHVRVIHQPLNPYFCFDKFPAEKLEPLTSLVHQYGGRILYMAGHRRAEVWLNNDDRQFLGAGFSEKRSNEIKAGLKDEKISAYGFQVKLAEIGLPETSYVLGGRSSFLHVPFTWNELFKMGKTQRWFLDAVWDRLEILSGGSMSQKDFLEWREAYLTPKFGKDWFDVFQAKRKKIEAEAWQIRLPGEREDFVKKSIADFVAAL